MSEAASDSSQAAPASSVSSTSPASPDSPVLPISEAIGRAYTLARPYCVGRAKIAEFAGALGDLHPAYTSPEVARGLGHTDVVAPPTFPVVVAFALLDQLLTDPELGLALHRVMHADQKFTMVRPLRAGDEVTAQLTIDRARRMGEADLIFTRTELATAAGEQLGEVAATVLHQIDTSGQEREAAQSTPAEAAGDAAARSVPPTPAYAEVARGTELPGLSVPVRRADVVRYAGASGDVNPIHWSDRVARSMGLPGVIAHGMLTMALTARAVTDWVGDPGRVLEYSTRFSTPVLVPDDEQGVGLTVGGTVGELLEDNRARIDLTARVGDADVLSRARAVVRLA